MRILGIDTSGKAAATALYDTQEHCFLAQQVLYTKRTHSQVILPLVQRMLQDVEISLSEIDCFAVANGPGSYTGLRIGIASVQGMAFAQQKPCVGISTLEGLAWQNLSWHGYICAALLARKNLVYAGVYGKNGSSLAAIEPDRMWDCMELMAYLQKLDAPILLTGDCMTMLPKQDGMFFASDASKLQNGTGICLAAIDSARWQKPEQLLPAYLQLVKAEKDFAEKAFNKNIKNKNIK